MRRSMSMVDKENETMEEKRARRLEKKAKKDEKRNAENELYGYTNADNRFHDTQLTEVFQWKKKNEKLKEDGKLNPDWVRGLKRQRAAQVDEIEAVKKRRIQREAEMKQREEDRAMQKKTEEEASAADWYQKGDQFAAVQLKIRADQRLIDGRPHDVDFMIKNLQTLCPDETLDPGYQADLREPDKIVETSSDSELQILRNDALVFCKVPDPLGFWASLKVVIEDTIAKRSGRTESETIQTDLFRQVMKTLQTKTLNELEGMEAEMQGKVRDGGKGVDVEFWDTILQRIKVVKARARLREIHEKVLEASVERLEEQQRKRKEAKLARAADRAEWDSESSGDEGETKAAAEADEREADRRRLDLLVEDKRKQRDNEKEQREAARLMNQDDKLGEDEELFGEEVELEEAPAAWHEKYRPRKPKYFNRVHTGYEWNKYNSTHYDADNPPPKVVMGYKFNVFYPDLVDARQQPTYYVEPTDKGWDDDVCIIRFHAGPPYEDIAFKIVNKHWEYSLRRGFKCTFERGVLHLYFSFVRLRYKR